MREYLEDWFNAKNNYLFDLFNNKLIIKKKVVFTEPTYSIRKKINENILDTKDWKDNVVAPMKRLLCALFFDRSFYPVLFSSATEEERQWVLDHAVEEEWCSSVFSIFASTAVFANNAIGAGHAAVLIPRKTNHIAKKLAITANEKPFKAISSLIHLLEISLKNTCFYNQEDFDDLRAALEKFRIIHSQCLNRKTIRGNLCFSIHPLDYMTMSHNGYNWESCMTWTLPHGDYCLGTIEMLNSPNVVVVYLEGDEEWYPTNSNWTWSNKKWRELFIVTENVISGIKGYPYQSNELTDEALRTLRDLCQNKFDWSYQDTIYDTSEDGTSLRPLADSYFTFSTFVMYNDTENNDFRYLLAEEYDFDISRHPEIIANFNHRIYISYSGEARCLKCGTVLTDEYDSADYPAPSSFYCDECDDRHYCEDCGCVLHSNDDYAYNIDGAWYCNECVHFCEVCDEPFVTHCGEEGYIDFVFKAQKKWITSTVEVCGRCFTRAQKYGWVKQVDLSDYHESPLCGTIYAALPDIDSDYKDACRAWEKYELVDFSVEQKS